MTPGRPLLVHPLTDLGEIAPGEDLARLLADALAGAGLAPPEPQDVLVVTSKVVSKAEGRLAALDTVEPGEAARELAARTGKDPRLVELALRESEAVVRAAPGVLITRHRLGLVMANAGIDQSNLGPGPGERALLLPLEPDRSADGLRARVREALRADLAVIVSDSFGRPWRQGVTNVAIGASGLPSLLDRRGEADRDGRRLEVTQVALADMLAGAAGLVMGEGGEGVPAALVRGFAWDAPLSPASALVRPLQQDLFR